MNTDALLSADLSQPLILKQNGDVVAVVLSVEVYESLQLKRDAISENEAKRLANQVVFQDLVGSALTVGQPVWVDGEHPRWRIPYRFVDGTLLKLVDVDARNREVHLPPSERQALLDEVEQLMRNRNVPS